MWFSLNLVCGPPDHASGVLIRAGEITAGADLAAKRRLSARNPRELAKGPARLAAALEVDRSLDGVDLCAGPDSPLSLLVGIPTSPEQVSSGPRTGVGGACRHSSVPFLDHPRPDGEPVPRPRATPPFNLTRPGHTPNVARAA